MLDIKLLKVRVLDIKLLKVGVLNIILEVELDVESASLRSRLRSLRSKSCS